ncbi:uncharacterized protein EAE98_005365 [Botrytis deweyae]|uniref:Uncharacterized protein n=1 Tax=Botrytis deweyae TaxID=2478750 RepID=A0ABQ7INN9_9HELO|nr:uncharacterized protein EAE98_005365 [Botrytis deweyae]KAF7929447.1 hypothetical protein EAE98_005365 [Botrytis deweyae]
MTQVSKRHRRLENRLADNAPWPYFIHTNPTTGLHTATKHRHSNPMLLNFNLVTVYITSYGGRGASNMDGPNLTHPSIHPSIQCAILDDSLYIDVESLGDEE